jgi:hypothetical protein
MHISPKEILRGIPWSVYGQHVELGLTSGEELINVLMCVTYKKEAEVYLLKDVKRNEKREKG